MNGFALQRRPWQPPSTANGYMPRGKNTAENDLQGTYERNTPVDSSVFTPEYLTERQREVISALIVGKVVEEIADRVPAEARPYPSLAESWTAAQLHAFAQKHPEHAAAVAKEIAGRKSPAWLPAEDVAACREWLGVFREPPPPAPTREPHSASYIEACSLVIAACHKQQIPLAILDPLRPDDPPTVPLDSRAAGPLFGEALLRRVEAGYHLGFAPHGRRAMPPSIDVPGHAFVPLQSGAGWVFSPIEVAK